MSKIKTRDKRVELLRHYSAMGKSLDETCKLIGVVRATAMKYCKLFGISFHDYKPRRGVK